MDRLREFLSLHELCTSDGLLPLLIFACILVVILLAFFRRHSNEIEWYRNYTQTLIDMHPDMVWLKDCDGVVLACNAPLASLYSMSVRDIIGKTDFDLVDSEIADAFREGDRKAIEAGLPTRREEKFVTKSGECQFFETIKSPMYDKKGKLIGILGMARNVTATRQAEIALQSSEQLFSTAFKLSPGPMAISLPEDGTIIDVNEAFVRVSGYNRDELIGRNRKQLQSWDDNAQFVECYRQLKAKGFVRDFEASFRKRNGEIALGLVSAQLVDIDSQERILWFTRDITEQRQAENALRNSQRKYSTVFHLSPNALLLTLETDGRPVEINAAFVNLCEADCHELEWKADFLSTIFATPGITRDYSEPLRRKGLLLNTEADILTMRGARRTCQVSAKRIATDDASHILWSFQDVTETKRAENALRVSEVKFSAAFRASPDAVVITRTGDGRIIDLNDGMVRLSGFQRDELIGQSPLQLNFWVNLSEQEAFIAGVREHGRVRDQEVNLRAKDGSIQFVLMSAEVFSIDGELHTLSVIHDITQRRLAEIELKNANSRLSVLSARLLEAQEAERRNLARELHDEIGQSLTAQKMALEGLGIRSGDPRLHDQIENITEITDRILNQVRQISLDLRPPQLDDLGLVAAIRWNVSQQSAIAGLVSHFSANGEIPVKLPESVAIASYRIVQEALNNVIKHSDAKNVWVSLDGIEDKLHLLIRDDGKGFVPEAQDARKSMGMAGMAERSLMVGGHLRVATQPGKGCSILAEMPIRQAAAP